MPRPEQLGIVRPPTAPTTDRYNVNRMQFLRADFSGRRAPQRPPWAQPESTFTEVCSRCGDCIQACPEGLLVAGRGGFPQVDFQRSGCSFCARCVDACAPHALRREHLGQLPWLLRAQIGAQCLSNQGIECRSCGEHCDVRAIRFRLTAGRVAHPQLDEQVCTGCGNCVSVCPASAISIQAFSPANTGVRSA